MKAANACWWVGIRASTLIEHLSSLGLWFAHRAVVLEGYKSRWI